MTAVEWLESEMLKPNLGMRDILEQAKEMEKNNTDNKVIHFAEWLTKKHTTVLMNLYEQFEEQFYNEEE
jgi:hypothetical protein